MIRERGLLIVGKIRDYGFYFDRWRGRPLLSGRRAIPAKMEVMLVDAGAAIEAIRSQNEV
ncbi:hypothetical protein D3C80_2018200 [compost metagenome]